MMLHQQRQQRQQQQGMDDTSVARVSECKKKAPIDLAMPTMTIDVGSAPATQVFWVFLQNIDFVSRLYN